MQPNNEPMFATTNDDDRFYEWPGKPGVHLPSITTIIKQGVPNPVVEGWRVGKTAELATDRLDTLIELRMRENGFDI